MRVLLTTLIFFIVLGCQKGPELGANYPRLIGTWSNDIVRITFKANGRIEFHQGFQRGFQLKVTSIEEFPLTDGSLDIRFTGRSTYEGGIRVNLSNNPDMIRILNPVVDTLWKI